MVPAPESSNEQSAVILFQIYPHAPIAQLVELRTFNPQVPGSSPGGGTTQDVPMAPQRK